jgi:MFS family permease
MAAVERTRWLVVLVAVAAGAVAAGHIGKVPPALPGFRAELGLGMVTAGWVVSMFNGLGSVVGMLLGIVGDHVGHRRFALFGLLVLAAGGILGARADGETVLLVSRAMEGVGFIAVVVSAPGLILAATTPGDRRFAFGLLGTYMPTGAALAMVVAPAVMAAAGWRGLWLSMAATAMAMALLLGTVTLRLPRLAGTAGDRAAAGALAGIAATVRRFGLWWLALAFGAYALQWTSLMVWLPSFLMESRGTGAMAAAGLTALIVAANAPGGLLGAWLLHHGVPRWWLVIGANAVMGLCGLGIFSDALADTTRYGLCLLFSGLGGILPAGVLAGAAVHAPTDRQIGAANGIVIQGSNLGQFIGPAAVAALVSATGNWHTASALLLAAAAVGVTAGVAAAICERRLPAPAKR